MAPFGFASKFAFLLSGLIVWLAHFMFVYGLNGLACARGFAGNVAWGLGVVPLIVMGATALALVLEGVIVAAAVRGRGPGIGGEPDHSLRAFWRFTTAATAAVSIVGIVWTAVPIFIIDPCA